MRSNFLERLEEHATDIYKKYENKLVFILLCELMRDDNWEDFAEQYDIYSTMPNIAYLKEIKNVEDRAAIYLSHIYEKDIAEAHYYYIENYLRPVIIQLIMNSILEVKENIDFLYEMKKYFNVHQHQSDFIKIIISEIFSISYDDLMLDIDVDELINNITTFKKLENKTLSIKEAFDKIIKRRCI